MTILLFPRIFPDLHRHLRLVKDVQPSCWTRGNFGGSFLRSWANDPTARMKVVQKDLKIGHIRHVFGIVNTPLEHLA